MEELSDFFGFKFCRIIEKYYVQDDFRMLFVVVVDYSSLGDMFLLFSLDFRF